MIYFVFVFEELSLHLTISTKVKMFFTTRAEEKKIGIKHTCSNYSLVIKTSLAIEKLQKRF